MSANLEKVEAIFSEALKISPADRPAFLDGACGNDPDLRGRLEELLRAEAQAGAFLPDAPNAPSTLVLPVTEQPGDRIGRYKLLQRIGEGGMGVVYMAEQEEPVRRQVALKIIKLGMDTRSVVARFEAERQALALMDHPNIAKVLDAGATEVRVAAGVSPAVEPGVPPGGTGVTSSSAHEVPRPGPDGRMPPSTAGGTPAATLPAGRPYFVMELVRGVPITTYCDKNHLGTAERLGLFIQVCHAIQHAHQKGIIHRDIKPSNVMVTLHDGMPVPKVIDFGVAKATGQRLTEKTLFTNYATMIGTPAYMSPEQAEMSGLDIDTRTDVYALGVLLYELLTGTTPFPSAELLSKGYGEMQRIIAEVEPARPSTRLSTMQNEERTVVAKNRGTEESALGRGFRGDLDWIVMKCLEKDRQRRYDTANGLAADLKRHLNNEPVVARPPTAAYRLQKLVRRNKLAFAAAGAVATALIAGVTIALWQAVVATRAGRAARLAEQAERARAEEARTERDRAAQARDTIRQNLYAGDMQLAMQAWEVGAIERARGLLNAHRPEAGLADLRGFEWRLLWKLCHQPQPFTLPDSRPIAFTTLSPDGRWLAEGDGTGRLRLWNFQARQFLELKGHQLPIGALAFSPDSRWLASGSGGLFHPQQAGELKLWDVSSAQHVRNLPGHVLRINSVTFSCDSRRLISVSADRTVRTWDVATGQPVPGLVHPEAEGLWMIASPTERVVAAGSGATVRLLDLDSGRLIHTFSNHAHNVWCVAFSRDGRRLATGGSDNLVFVQDVAQGKLEAVLPQANIVSVIAFSPDGGRLACGTIDKLTLWDLARRREIGAIRGLKGGVTSLDFTPDGSTLVTSAESQPPQYWDMRQLLAEENIRRLDANGVQALAISPDGRYLAVGEGDFFQPFKPSNIRLWELPSGREVGVFKGHTAAVTLLAFDADGRGLISASLDQTARRWDVPSGRAVPLAASTNGDWGTVAAVSPQGRLATYRMNEPPATNTLNIVDPVTGQVLATFPSALANLGSVPVARFSPDGSLVAAMGETNVVTVWEVTSRPRAPTLQHSDDQTNMTFSPDGRYLASWHRVATLSQPDGLMSLAFSPDGRYLATGSENGRVRLLDIRSGRVVTDLEGHRHVVVALAFTPDGARLVSASIDRTIKIWSLPAGRELITLKGHQVNLTAAVFSPDGNTLITSSADGEVRFWRAATADEIAARDNAGDTSTKPAK